MKFGGMPVAFWWRNLGMLEIWGGPVRGFLWGVCTLIVGAGVTLDAEAQTSVRTRPSAAAVVQSDAELMWLLEESDSPAPVDRGFGPGVPVPKSTAPQAEALAAPAGAPVGGAAAQTQGVFGGVVTWPIIAIHALLLPDGRVLSYGTTQTGQQGGQLVYDVWDPRLGTGTVSHNTLPNGTGTDIFCSGQSVLAASGEVLITGGDRTLAGKRNYSIPDTTIFNPGTDTLRPAAPMAYDRWYPTIVPLPSRDMLILGGREDPGYPARTPEVYQSATGTWRTLPNASSDAAFGTTGWFYPRAFQSKNGKVFVLGRDGKMFYVTPAGQGTITQIGQTLAGNFYLPTLMFEPGKLLSLRLNRKAIVVNLNGPSPVITTTANLDQVRHWSNATVLADGKVLVNGGSAVTNQLSGVAYDAQLWNPATGQWTQGANAVKPRLYHSTSLLLPDGSVLTGGGGAPGPVKNLNAEIYYPLYLYKQDGSGQPADRPTISTAPASVILGQAFQVTMGTAGPFSRVTLLRMGSVTHAFNADQRFFNLTFAQNGQQLTITPPTDVNIALPGDYMLFVFQGGVPSVAKIVRVRT